MRFSSPYFQSIGLAITNPTMSSSRFNARGRGTWFRGFCDRPPTDGRGGRGGRGGGGLFVSGDSHLRTVRDDNFGFQKGYWGDSSIPFPRDAPQQQFRPRPPAFRPNPPSRPADHRNWIFSNSQLPPQCERFIVLSYNILADYLARDHRSELYFHIPHHILDWEWRKRKLFLEFGLWAPDIMCLQEVDRFHDLEEELAIRGYNGIWKMRTGNATDGCAIFWRRNRFQLRHEEHIEFNKLGLRDNVAQICVLESRIQIPAENPSASWPASSYQSRRANQVVICNIHVLYNPKRGEIKLGQVRTLLDRAYAVSRIWNDAPIIICGDFNCTPKSPLYKFISEQKLSLSGLSRDQVSGQHSARIYAPRSYIGPGLYRARPSIANSHVTAIGVKQGNCYKVTDSHVKPQHDIEKASLTEKLSSPPSLTSMLNTSGKPCSDCRNTNGIDILTDSIAKEVDEADMLDGCFSDSASTKCRIVDPSQGNGESCKEQSEILANIGKNGNQVLAPIVTFNDDPCSGVQLDHGCSGSDIEMVHSIRSMFCDYCSQSSANVSSELIDSLYLDSSSKDQELSQGLVDSSAEEKSTSKIFMGTSVVSTTHENFNICKEDMNANRASSVEVPSDMSPEKALFDEALLDNKLLDDDVTENYSFEMASGTFSANIEVSTLESTEKPSAYLINEEQVGAVVSCQNTCEFKPSDLSSPGNSSQDLKLVGSYLNDVGRTMMGDANSDGDHGNSNSAENLAHIHENATENVTIHDLDSCNISIQPNAEEASQSFVKSCSAGGTRSGQLDYSIGGGQGCSMINDSCSSEEISDPNFLKELLGTEDACDQSFSSLPGHIAGKEKVNSEMLDSTYLHRPELAPQFLEDWEDLSRKLAPHTNLEKHSYNPYLWTPMEIEVASGNAECTFVEHNLKLRSAYADVEDYAGTKDSSREPQVTSYNRQFMGTVDYIWCSEGLQTIKVLDTLPKHVLLRTPGFPTPKWGSDHLSLACQLAFTNGFQTTK